MPYTLKSFLERVRKGFGEGRKFYLARDVIALEEPPKDAVILRFDVERDLEHHLEVGKVLAEAGVPCTMYFHTRKACYDPRVLHEIEDMGHEVGYHHECLDRCGGDFRQAAELFQREVELFRKDGFKLETVCSHGEAGLRKVGYRSNWDLFEQHPDLLEKNDLDGEVYHWLRDHAPLYASDTFRGYNNFWKVLDEAATMPKPLMILVHPHRWRNNPAVMLLEVGHDLLRHVSNRVFHKRSYNLAY